MSDLDQPFVFAATQVIATEMIDGGRTLAIRLRRADGSEAVILLPLHVAHDLRSHVADALDVTASKIGNSKL